jgi:hypothetical protein
MQLRDPPDPGVHAVRRIRARTVPPATCRMDMRHFAHQAQPSTTPCRHRDRMRSLSAHRRFASLRSAVPIVTELAARSITFARSRISWMARSTGVAPVSRAGRVISRCSSPADALSHMAIRVSMKISTIGCIPRISRTVVVRCCSATASWHVHRFGWLGSASALPEVFGRRCREEFR